jgi:uncharacterized protein YggU (UPF0235/DUF167 family)
MRIIVIAKARAKETKIKQIDPTTYEISVREVPAKGKANNAIIKALAVHLKIAPSRLHIKRGQTSKKKFIEVI